MAELRIPLDLAPSRFRLALGVDAAALAAGALAAAGWAWAAIALAAVLALVWAGTRIAWIQIQTVLLLALLLVPDAPSGQSFGLQIAWSHGLTWSNFVIPALAAPLVAGAWWSGRKIWPARWPKFAVGLLALLGWSLLTLLPVWAAGALGIEDSASLLAHMAKLALFLLLGVVLVSGGSVWYRRAEQLLLAGIAVNAAVGLGQAAGRLPVFSTLAQGALGARATGLFYDANFYAISMSWALLWLLCQPLPRGWRRWAGVALTLAMAGNLVAAGSRAGYAGFVVGAMVLWGCGRRRAVGRAVLLLAAVVVLFPLRSWQRVESAAGTLEAAWTPPVVATAPVDASTQDRLDSMRQAWRQFLQHPVLGAGFGRALYLGIPALGDAGAVAPARPFRGAQDMALTVLAGTGPVGLALLLLAACAPLGLMPRRDTRFYYAPVLAGYAGVLTACLTQEVLWNARLLVLVVVLTAGVGIGCRSSSQVQEVKAL